MWFSYIHPQGTCREWTGRAELLSIKEAPLSVEIFQQPHHNHSLITTQLIQNSACSTFSTNVLRCLTDGEKQTAGKMLVPDYSDSSRARAAVLGPGSRTINSLCWTRGSLARKVLCLSGLPQPTDLLWRTTACHLLSSPALQHTLAKPLLTVFNLGAAHLQPTIPHGSHSLLTHQALEGWVNCTWKSPARHLSKLQSCLWAEKEQRSQGFGLVGPSLTRMAFSSGAGSSSPHTLSPSPPVPPPPQFATVAVCGVGQWPRLTKGPWFKPRHIWKSSSGIKTGCLGYLSQQSYQKKHLSAFITVQCLNISPYTDESACLTCWYWRFCYMACWQ